MLAAQPLRYRKTMGLTALFVAAWLPIAYAIPPGQSDFDVTPVSTQKALVLASNTRVTVNIDVARTWLSSTRLRGVWRVYLKITLPLERTHVSLSTLALQMST